MHPKKIERTRDCFCRCYQCCRYSLAVNAATAAVLLLLQLRLLLLLEMMSLQLRFLSPSPFSPPLFLLLLVAAAGFSRGCHAAGPGHTWPATAYLNQREGKGSQEGVRKSEAEWISEGDGFAVNSKIGTIVGSVLLTMRQFPIGGFTVFPREEEGQGSGGFLWPDSKLHWRRMAARV